MTTEKLAQLLTQGVSFKNQSADVCFLAMIHHYKAFSRHERIRVHIDQNADFTGDRDYVFFSRSGPDRRPLVDPISAHNSMIAKLHPQKYTGTKRSCQTRREPVRKTTRRNGETRQAGESKAVEIKVANLRDRAADVLL
jgi:hypothetical protein